MKGNNLGEFEELVLLLVGILYEEAYGVAVQRGLEEHVDRRVKISAVHSTLSRLEKKGYVVSRMGGATSDRGGRRKRLFTLTEAGRVVLDERRQERASLWQMMPRWAASPIPNLGAFHA